MPRSSTPSVRHAPALAVLDGTRGVVRHGWLQHETTLVRHVDGHLRHGGPGEVVRACLVGAVVEAARRYDGSRLASGPALDALWLALVDPAGREPAVGRVPAPAVRMRRARELAHWNDVAGRTQDEVLGLIDDATARVAAELAAPAAAERVPADA